MNSAKMDAVIEATMYEVVDMSRKGRSEYTHNENVFDNFQRVAKLTGIDQERALMIYMLKHIDGIANWVKGHRSQRESVHGRILDAIVYLCLLRGMVIEREQEEMQTQKMVSTDDYQTRAADPAQLELNWGNAAEPEDARVRLRQPTPGLTKVSARLP